MIAKATIGIIPDYKFPDWLGLPWTSEVCYSLVCDLLRIIGIFQSHSITLWTSTMEETFFMAVHERVQSEGNFVLPLKMDFWVLISLD